MDIVDPIDEEIIQPRGGAGRHDRVGEQGVGEIPAHPHHEAPYLEDRPREGFHGPGHPADYVLGAAEEMLSAATAARLALGQALVHQVRLWELLAYLVPFGRGAKHLALRIRLLFQTPREAAMEGM